MWIRRFITQKVLLPPGIGWRVLIKRTYAEAWDDDVLSLAAQQAYYLFFALFPALLVALSVASFFPLVHLIDDVVDLLAFFAPADVILVVQQQMLQLSQRRSGGILTLASLFALWSSSGAMTAIITTLNAAYDVSETRPWWRTRLTAIALTVGIAIFILTSMFLVLAGPGLAAHLASRLYLGDAFKWAWWTLQWPLIFALVVVAMELIYYFAPNVDQRWTWISPGSMFATILWLGISVGLKLYYKLMPDANATYGALGGVMALLLWFYCSGIAMLLGAELNAEIAHASAPPVTPVNDTTSGQASTRQDEASRQSPNTPAAGNDGPA